MPRKLTAPAPLVALALLAGCSTTKPLEPFPGFGESASPSQSPATLHEADNVYIESIDGHPAQNHFDLNLLGGATYRQYHLPPGPHHIVVRYYEQAGQGSISLPSTSLKATLDKNTSYTLKSNRDFIVGPFMKNQWHPSLTNDTTHQVIAQTTSP